MINDKRPADHCCEETCVSEPEVIDSPGNDVTTQVMFSSPLESPDHFAMPSFYTASKLKLHSLWRDLLPTVSASSEAVKPKFQSTDASVLGHFMSPQNSALSASSTVGSSIVPPSSSSSSSSTQSTVSSSARTSSSGNEDHAAHKADTSRVSHVPVQQPSIGSIRSFRPGIRREGEFVCGWGAAFINICVTFPINKAMFRQQLHGISGLRAFGQLRKDGLRYLYRGLLPPLMQKTSSLSIMFGMYYRCQDAIKEQAPDLNVYANHTLAALASGTIEAMFMPFERIQTLMQTRQYHNKFANTVDAFHGLKAYGIREYYRGFSLIILRNGPSNVAFFLGREYLQEKGPQCNTSGEKMLQDFICGACLGAIISTVFFPLNVVKTHMQCRLGGPFDGVWPTFKVVLQERNGSIRGLFRGIHLNYTRSFISWGIINASFEYLMKTFFTEECKTGGRIS